MMCKMSKREYLQEVKKKYRKAGKKQKSQLLNDFCEFTGYHRKYALQLFNSRLSGIWKRYKQRARKYDQKVVDTLLVLWRAADEICAERLHPYIGELLDKLISCEEIAVDHDTISKLRVVSQSTVKRVISHTKHRSFIKIGGTTRPGSLLKGEIAVRCGRWTDTEPGWLEIDTVAHCGDTVAGEFIYTVNTVDISSGWSEQAAIWGRGERATVGQIDGTKRRLPFPLKGLDSDNGSEFINWHLHRYCKKNKLALTRSRAYHKNDNAHVEQKNWTAIRQLVGYRRLDRKEQLILLNDLYQNEWRLYLNFFQPTMKLKEKIKDAKTGKARKRYYEAKTPYRRILNHLNVAKEQKDMLICQYRDLNPIKLKQAIIKKLELIRRTLK